MEGIFWLAVIILMSVIEIITLGLTTIWFAGGALVAFLAYLLGANLVMQAALFVLVSVVLLAATRPLAVKFFNKDRTKTNVDSLIGKTAVVIEGIDNLNQKGRVSVNGQEWMARAVDGMPIPQNSQVEIVDIIGVKLLVKEDLHSPKSLASH